MMSSRQFLRRVAICSLASMLAMLGSRTLCHAADWKIKIVSVSLNGEVVNITGELEGQAASLMCMKSAPECTVPERALYVAVQLSPEASEYNDCLNVDLYRYDEKNGRGDKAGLYCLLAPDLRK